MTKHLRQFLILGVYLVLGNPLNKIKPLIYNKNYFFQSQNQLIFLI